MIRFGRRRKRNGNGDAMDTGSELGVGAFVSVASESGTDNDWPDDLGGVIVGVGNTEITPYPGLTVGRRRQWLVSFDPPAYLKDGRGPFARASIPADLLTPLPFDQT